MNPVDAFFAAMAGGPLPNFTPDFKAKVNGNQQSKADMIQWLESIAAAFQDIKLERLGALEQGNDIAIRWQFTGTQIQPWHHRSPPGSTVTFEGMTRFTVEGAALHRLASRWDPPQ